jgi:hypothetical protein
MVATRTAQNGKMTTGSVRGGVGKLRWLVMHAIARRDDLDSGTFDFAKKSIEHGTLQEDIPAGSRRLPENHMGDSFALGELEGVIRLLPKSYSLLQNPMAAAHFNAMTT